MFLAYIELIDPRTGDKFSVKVKRPILTDSPEDIQKTCGEVGEDMADLLPILVHDAIVSTTEE